MLLRSLPRVGAILCGGSIFSLFFLYLVGCGESSPPPPAVTAAATKPAIVRTISLTVNTIDAKGAVTGVLSDAVVGIDKTATITKTTDGKWVFTVPENGTYTLTASRAGYLTATQSVSINTNVTADKAITLRLPATSKPVSVTVSAATGATIKTETIPAVAEGVAITNATPTLVIASDTVVKVDGVTPTAPVAIAVTPVPASAIPVAVEATPTATTTHRDETPLGGFVLQPPGLTTDKPMTLHIPISAYELDDATASALSPFNLEIVDPADSAGSTKIGVKGIYVAPTGTATEGTIQVTLSAFDGSRSRGRGLSGIITLNLQAASTITPGSSIINGARSPAFGAPCSVSGVCQVGMTTSTSQLNPVLRRIANSYQVVLEYRYSSTGYMAVYPYNAGPYGPTPGLKYYLRVFQKRITIHSEFGSFNGSPLFKVDFYDFRTPELEVTTETYVAPPKPAGTGGGGSNR
jgi:hypothetical protein